MKKRNIFERAVAARSTMTFFQKNPTRRQQQKKILGGGTTLPIKMVSFHDLNIMSVAGQVGRTIKFMLARNQKLSWAQKQVDQMKEVRQKSSRTMIPISEVYWGAWRSGKPIPYYEAETVSLCSDQEYVVANHNIDLLTNEIERIKKRTVREALRQTKAFTTLSSEERKRVLQLLGIRYIFPEFETKKQKEPILVNVPPVKIVVHPSKPDGDDWEPDPEILEHFEVQQAAYEYNGDGKRGGRGRAEYQVRGMMSAGEKLSIIYASKKGESVAVG